MGPPAESMLGAEPWPEFRSDRFGWRTRRRTDFRVRRRLNEEAVTEDRLSNVDSESWNRRQRLESPSFEVEGSPEMFSNFSREGS